MIEHDILDEEIQESPRSGSRKQYYKTNNEETRTHKSRKRCNDMQVERDSTKQLKTIQTENKTSENEFDLFCRNLAIQLTNMPLQRALICQQKLLSVMVKERLRYISASSPSHYNYAEVIIKSPSTDRSSSLS